jgi:hypothetical protein|tara:strand:+ start:437 stop:1144 length:708 start_codon:yes stop_codon:yes gene_type:complete
MARISTYSRDLEVNDYDAWIGTDSATRATKQFTAKAVAEYLNIKGKISISAQMVFYYWTANSANTQTPGAGDFYGPSINTPMTSITTMQLYKTDRSGQDVVAFMDYLVGNNILISAQNDISIFGHFKIDSYTINNPNDDFYTLNLINIAGSGNLTPLLHYDFAVFQLSSQQAPTFVFSQVVPSVVWNVNHNLGKFPSISVVDTANTVVTGQYNYTDNNNVTLTFSAGFAGKAYLN